MAFVPMGGVVKLSKTGRLVYGEVSRDAQLLETKKGGYFVKFSVMCGLKDGTDEKQYIECKAFDKATVNYCRDLTRGDPICLIGDMESREYDGKTYWDLKVAWVNSPSVIPDMGVPAEQKQTAASYDDNASGDGPKFYEADDDLESELPF